MSARRARRAPDGPPPPRPPAALESVEQWPDGDWTVRRITGSAAAKSYRCPGCDQEIRPATPHVVAWPADAAGGSDDRRHWHTACWRSRMRRSVKVHRARNAPRYG